MSSPKRRRVSTRDRAAVESISTDVLHDIVARLDTTTVVRFAATCKPIRRAILHPDLPRCIALRAEAGGGGSGFVPALLLGLSYVYQDTLSSDAASLLRSYELVASRGSLFALHPRGGFPAELRVVNSLTGHVSRVPPPPGIPAVYPRALLAVGGGGGGSFRLLVAGRNLRMRVYSSEHGEWGKTIDPHLPPDFIDTVPNRNSPALVLGGTTVHWLCKDKGIVALDVVAARATAIKLPPRCFRRVMHVKHQDQGLLAASRDGKLSLLVAKPAAICMWTLADGEWGMEVVVRRHDIPTWESACFFSPTRRRRAESVCLVRFLGFGERSGTVILQMQQVGLVEISLKSFGARVLDDKLKEIGTCRPSQMQLCLHETDLSTLLKNMKRF